MEGMTPKRTVLERLPIEIQQQIIGHVSLGDLDSIALASRAFNGILKDGEGPICYNIAAQMMGQRILPLAIARLAASRANWRPDVHGNMPGNSSNLSNQIVRFGKTYLIDGPKTLLNTDLRKLASSHKKFEAVAQSYAQFCLLIRSEWNSQSPWPQFPLTAGELCRFIRALYIMEITREIIPVAVPRAEGFENSPSALLWLHFTLWEHRQVEFLMSLLRPFCQHKYSARYGLNEAMRSSNHTGLESYEKWQMLRGIEGLHAVVKSRHLRYGFFFHELSRSPEVYNPSSYPDLRTDFRLEDGDATWLNHPNQGGRVKSLEVESLRAAAEINPMSVWVWELTSDFVPVDDFVGFTLSVAAEEWSIIFWDSSRLGIQEWSAARCAEY